MELIRLQIETIEEVLRFEFSGFRAEGVFCLGIPAAEHAAKREKELYRCGKALAALFGYADAMEQKLYLLFHHDGLEYRLSYENGARVLRQGGLVCSDAVYAQFSDLFRRQVMQVDTAKRMLLGEQAFYDPKPVEAFLAFLAEDERIAEKERVRQLRLASGDNRLRLSFLDEISGRYLENLSYASGRYFEKLSSYRYRFLMQKKELLILDLHSGKPIRFVDAPQQLQFLAATSVACGMQEMAYSKDGMHFPYLLLCDSFDAEELDPSAVRSYFYRLAKRNAG